MIAGDDTSNSLDNSSDELATEAGVDMQGTQAAIPVLEGIPVADDVGDLEDLPVRFPSEYEGQALAVAIPRRMRSRSRSPCRMRAPHRSRMSCREVGRLQQSNFKFALKQLLKDTVRDIVVPQTSGIASGIASSTLSARKSLPRCKQLASQPRSSSRTT